MSAIAAELRQRLEGRIADARRVVREARLVLDTRNLTGGPGQHPHIVRL